ELVGTKYVRPFDLILSDDAGPNAWTVHPADFVTAEDGTGIVHLAPAFGADDYAMGQKFDLPMYQPLDEAGRFREWIPQVGGMFVKEADAPLVEDMKQRGILFHYALQEHSYPHCWRCGSPLIYMARETWYIRTTSVKDEMVRNNKLVGWHPPEIGAGRFGEWLEGNVDWALSRDRYWGTPLPIWVCDQHEDHTVVIESFRELEIKAGGLPEPFNPHKPFIDAITWKCDVEGCDGTMRRTPEVIDAWFDSGSMPYAQWHYPFENREVWQAHFPADFICEGLDQTRGWFYSLMAIATMLGDGPPYRNVIVNELVLDAEGQKMSKSRGNVVNPVDVMAPYGADAVRWYLVTVSQPWVPKRFDTAALAEASRRVFDTLVNTYKFFALYANLEQWRPDSGAAVAPTVLDRWILSRLDGLVAQVRADLEDYEVTRSMRSVGEFIVDDLSNWYIRRNRDRFWGSAESADARAAFQTLHRVLTDVARLLAPVTPFQADWLHRALTGESVHLARFPEPVPGVRDESLERGMSEVRVLSRLGRAAREEVRIKVRQPLRTLFAVVPGREDLSEELLAIVRDELNVKEIRFLGAAEELVSLRANPNFKTLGPKFGKATQQAAAAIRELPSSALSAFRRGETVTIVVGDVTHALEPEHLTVFEEAKGELVV
ncbi:MAG TPA: class I tRNA ligase family protein, partial [Longimicrobiales bacterium]